MEITPSGPDPDGSERQSLRRSQVDEIFLCDDDSGYAVESSISSSSSSYEPQSAAEPEDDDDLPEDDSAAVDSWSDVASALENTDDVDGSSIERPHIELRAPVICVLGHVDTGKTTLLDKLRRSAIQASEAGGITQQMGATFVPIETLREKTAAVNNPNLHVDINFPGILVLDTPGHASFGGMRSRGATVCDVAILVIDIMHGIESTTREAIQMLRERHIPFVIALNKIDRLFKWKSVPDAPIISQLKRMTEETKREFEERLEAITRDLRRTEGIPAVPYYNNHDFKKFVSIVPISAMTGEGMADLFFLLMLLAQKFLFAKLTPQKELKCTVLEVRHTEGFGYTLNVILINGTLNIGDTIIAAGLEGPITSRIRSIIVPPSLQEIRDTSKRFIYQGHVKRATGAVAVKLAGRDFDKIVPGSAVYVPHNRQNVQVLKSMVMSDVDALTRLMIKSNAGVCVHASSLGSLEALMGFLVESGIPVRKIKVGNVTSSDVTIAEATNDQLYRLILAFDVKVSKDALARADRGSVTIFAASIIYHLIDQFRDYARRLRRDLGPASRKVPFRLKLKADGPIYDAPLTFSAFVEGQLDVGAVIRRGADGLHERVAIIRRFEDGTPLASARTGDIVTIQVENQRHFGYLDTEGDDFIPDVIGMDKNRLYELQAPPEWRLRAQRDPFVTRLTTYLEGLVLRANQQILLERERSREEYG